MRHTMEHASFRISDLSDGTSSRSNGRVAAGRLPQERPVEVELDRDPSMSFLDGFVRALRESDHLESVTFVTASEVVLRNLGRFVAHDPSLDIWVRTAASGRIRVEPPAEDPIEIEEGPIGEEIPGR